MPSDPPPHPRGTNETILVVTAVISLVITIVVALFGDGLLTRSTVTASSDGTDGGPSWVVDHLWLSLAILFFLAMGASWLVGLNTDSDTAWGVAMLSGGALVLTLVLWAMVEWNFWWTVVLLLALTAIIGLAMSSMLAVVIGLVGVLLVGWLAVSFPFWVVLVAALAAALVFLLKPGAWR